MKHPTLFLVLIINAATSALAGLLLLLVPALVANLMGDVAPWICQWMGAGLLLFAVGVALTAWQLPRVWHCTGWILALDIVWLVATPIVMWVFAAYLSLVGQALLVLVALWVLVFACYEAYWLKRPPASTR